METKHYSIIETYEKFPSHTEYKFHTHEYYEIHFFLEGDLKFVVENKTYTLEPNDIVVTKKHELHNISLEKATPYHRIILMIRPSFFQVCQCPEFEQFFLNTSPYSDNKISAKVVRNSGLYDAFKRYRKYSENYKYKRTPLLYAIVMEILYLINNIDQFATPDYSNTHLEQLILYLNKHYTEDISLAMLEKRFFLSKAHLCKTFRDTTGLTIFDYIRKKRLAMVQDLTNSGMNLLDASREAGFHDYSSFYRAYSKEFGVSPKKNLK